MLQKYIDEIRSFNRYYTDIIGLLEQNLLDSDFTLPEARVLYEIYHHEGILAGEITSNLSMDKGYLSRILLRFEKQKLIAKKRSANDGRAVHISLTEKGIKSARFLNDASNEQIKDLFGSLSEKEHKTLISHMTGIRELLSKPVKRNK